MIDHAPHSTKVQDQAPPALSGIGMFKEVITNQDQYWNH